MDKEVIALLLVSAALVLIGKRNASPLFDYRPPERAKPYLPLLEDAEKKHGLPRHLLTKVAEQESNFRSDIINGQVTSTARS